MSKKNLILINCVLFGFGAFGYIVHNNIDYLVITNTGMTISILLKVLKIMD